VALLTSKGASGVTGAGFITLAATLAVVKGVDNNPAVPVAGLVLILGVDRFMSEARALTNLIGNGVAAIVISKWEKGLDTKAMDKALAGK
jgi:aerobic C4-dicarboxylate transport protein